MQRPSLFSIDAQYYTFGSSYVTNNPTIDASANLLVATDVAILPQSIVTTAGRIGSIQFYSSGAGSITIYVIHLKTLSSEANNHSVSCSYFVGCVRHP